MIKAAEQYPWQNTGDNTNYHAWRAACEALDRLREGLDRLRMSWPDEPPTTETPVPQTNAWRVKQIIENNPNGPGDLLYTGLLICEALGVNPALPYGWSPTEPAAKR